MHIHIGCIVAESGFAAESGMAAEIGIGTESGTAAEVKAREQDRDTHSYDKYTRESQKEREMRHPRVATV